MSIQFRLTFIGLMITATLIGCNPVEKSPTHNPLTATPQIEIKTKPFTAAPTILPPTPTQALPTEIPSPTYTTSPPPKTTDFPPTPEPTSTPIPPVSDILDDLRSLDFDLFLVNSYRQLKIRDPDILVMNKFEDFYRFNIANTFSNISPSYVAQTQQLQSGLLGVLESYDREILSYEQQISYDAYHWYLEMLVRGQAYTENKVLVNPVWGLQNMPVDFLLERPLKTKADAEKYIARLENIDPWMDQVCDQLTINQTAETLPPSYVIEDTIAAIDALISKVGNNPPVAEKTDLYTYFHLKVKSIEEIAADERDALDKAAMAAIETHFIPAFISLREKLISLVDAAISDPDQWTLPGGKDYYEYLLEYHSGTDLDASQIHAMALAEVERLQSEIRDAAVELGYPEDITMSELSQRIFQESSIITGNQLLKKYDQILTDAHKQMEDYFDLRSGVDVVIKKNADGPPAYYQLPKPGSEGPGIMPVNPEIHPLYVNYNEYVLTHHETIPGHHTQLSLSQRLQLPDLQRFSILNPYTQDYILQAYVEGWALYAETLAYEMGLYENAPLENLGRLRLHLLRTVRAVVDTGIHSKGWSLQEAADYIERTTGVSQTRSQLTRYLVNPGYAVGYNIGSWKIHEMRQRTQDQLGNSFDIKEFHNTILGHGILPIHVLEQVVDDWIASQLY